jgi:4-hydroxy-3-methylbut-2-enyl diphosphate reductase
VNTEKKAYQVIKAPLGFCVGIVNTYQKLDRLAAERESLVATHQNSLHERDTLKQIERQDPHLLSLYPSLKKVSVVHDRSSLASGTEVVLGFHGLPAAEKEDMKSRGVGVLKDLQCPFISRMDRVAERLAREGFDLLVMGKKESHHCSDARRLAEKHGRSCVVLEKTEEVEAISRDAGQNWALIGQVTGNTETWRGVIEHLEQRGIPVKVVNTLCSDSFVRQDAARELARQADVVILVDDGVGTAGATQSVFEVCREVHQRVHKILRKEDIRREWLENAKTVGVIGGILIPQWTIDETAAYLEDWAEEGGP